MEKKTREEVEAYGKEVKTRAKWIIASMILSTIALICNIILLYKLICI